MSTTIQTFLREFQPEEFKRLMSPAEVTMQKRTLRRRKARKDALVEACQDGNLRQLWLLVSKLKMDVNEVYHEDHCSENDDQPMFTPLLWCIRHANPWHADDYLRCMYFLLIRGSKLFNNELHSGYDENTDSQEDLILFLIHIMQQHNSSEFHSSPRGTYETMYLQMLALILHHAVQTHQVEDMSFYAEYSQLRCAIMELHQAQPYLCTHTIAMLLETRAFLNCSGAILCMALNEIQDEACCMQVCQLLLQAGADVNETDEEEECTPLIAAIKRVHADDALPLTHLLLDARGVKPNLCIWYQGFQLPCLYFAAKHPHQADALLRLLLTYGADPFAEDADGDMIMDTIQTVDNACALKILSVMQSPHHFMTPKHKKKTYY